ncbi:MAG: prolipoprotein diacylglyceryl transferase [Actinomycetota bacterium]
MLAAIPFRTCPSFSVGPLTIRTFGVFVALGILLGVWLFLRYARERGLDPDLLSRLAWQVIVLGIIGSRALFVVTNWSEFQGDPLSVFALWEGGLQFSGSFLISIVVIWWFARRHPEMPGLAVSDGVVYGLAPGLVIGRLGCMAVGEHLGTRTSFVLGWRYLGGETREPVAGGVDSVIHSTALYEIVLLLPLVALLWWMQRRRVPDGWLTATFLLWYGTQRFLTDFLRTYDETVAGLTGAQFLSLGMVAGGLVLAFRLRRRDGEAGVGVTDAGAPAA